MQLQEIHDNLRKDMDTSHGYIVFKDTTERLYKVFWEDEKIESIRIFDVGITCDMSEHYDDIFNDDSVLFYETLARLMWCENIGSGC